MAPEEEAEIHPRTGYIPWSDAKLLVSTRKNLIGAMSSMQIVPG